YTEGGDQFQPYRQSHAAQIIHRLVEREAASVAKSSVCAPELVLDNITGITKQDAPRLRFSLDDVTDNSQQLVEQLLLRSAKRGLVRDLEEVADDLTALAVKSTIRQPHLL